MVFVAVKNIKSRENELIFVVDQLLEQLNVIWIRKMVPSKAVYVGHQLLLAFWEWTLGSLTVSAKLLCQSSKFEA